MIDPLNIILAITLGILLILEIWNYGKFITAANNLNNLGIAMQEAFKGVSVDIVAVNNVLEDIGDKVDELDGATDILNSNDALIETYLTLFADALAIDPNRLSRIGTLKFPEAE